MQDIEAARVAAECAALREVERFMLQALRVALASGGTTPARRIALLGLREQATLWRAQRLSLGAQPQVPGDAATAAHAAFRETFAESMLRIEALIDELE